MCFCPNHKDAYRYRSGYDFNTILIFATDNVRNLVKLDCLLFPKNLSEAFLCLKSMFIIYDINER